MTETQLGMLHRRLRAHSRPLAGGSEQAAVLLPVSDDSARPELLLGQRAENLSRHGGEVAFPGGRREKGDLSLLETALRESTEETHMQTGQVKILARLPAARTRFGFSVAPFVGQIPADLELQPDGKEFVSLFRVPLDFFCPENLLADEYRLAGKVRRIPRFDYQGYDIWGFTAMLIITFCRIGLEIRMDPKAVAAEHVRRRVF